MSGKMKYKPSANELNAISGFMVFFRRWAILWIAILLLMLIPFSRAYILARLGNSDAMYFLSCEYGRDNSMYVRRNNYKSNYWIRKSASSGNIHAIVSIECMWSVLKPEEVVYWLRRGVEFGHPWCADRLAWGYRCGMYGLPMDPVMEANYRKIEKELQNKK
ncbi:MAG: hypothetical protein H6Q00_2860 [Holophagaceae bacterium]|nr:hypothetical protein [Holophagaceae bacterium]